MTITYEQVNGTNYIKHYQSNVLRFIEDIIIYKSSKENIRRKNIITQQSITLFLCNDENLL